MVKKSAISGLVSKTFDDAKSGGCKKVRNRAAAGFVGLSERNILRETNSKIKYRIHNVKFTNKATPRPVTAKSVQAQHQVDLMDLSKDAVEHDGRVFRYVLSVMDVLAGILGCAHWKRKQVIMLAKPLKRSTQNMVHQIAFKATVDRSLKEKLDLFVRH